MHESRMAYTTITISTEAQRRLAALKSGRESYSAVILREVPEPPLETCGEIEDALSEGVPKADATLRRAMLTGRGRRSNRKR
jgi:predicted CopG family antitoxin